MSDKPILFNGESIRAILYGRKTQTRRVIKPQPWQEAGKFVYQKGRGTFSVEWFDSEDALGALLPLWCPYGQPGDRLWVRETWATIGNFDCYKPSELPLTHFSAESHLVYRATAKNAEPYYRWRPSIYMPRWASRITLEVTGVRVERVQEITQDDAMQEGLVTLASVSEFRRLWDSINEKRGFPWSSNPWVWVVEFKREASNV